MKYLLDTHILVWYLTGSSSLKASHLALIENPNNTILVSQVSLWEISIKAGIGKLSVPLGMTFRQLEQHLIGLKIELCSLEAGHFDRLMQLPFHHRDPFDRMLVAQAMVERATFLTNDDLLKPYFGTNS